MKSFFGLEDKTVVITGGNGGVGAATAQLCSALAGARVALISRRGAEHVADGINKAGGIASSYRADVSDCEQLENVFERIVSDHGPVQSLVNTAGICEYYSPESSPLDKTKIDEQRWNSIISINGKGPALAIHFATKSMPSDGTIVNVASTAGKYGAEFSVIDYTFSKGGMVAMTIGYAKILGGLGIRVNGVAPGPIEGTEMLSNADEDSVKAAIAATRLGRLSTPEDIAKVNLFLASSMSGVITGVTIDSNAGQFMAV